jgi:hypothetical protein
MHSQLHPTTVQAHIDDLRRSARARRISGATASGRISLLARLKWTPTRAATDVTSRGGAERRWYGVPRRLMD